LEQGANPDIYLISTHAVFSGPAVERLKEAKVKEVIVTDTIPLTEEAKKLGYKEKQKGHSRINAVLCDGCGQCAPLCKFKAIVLAGEDDEKVR
jgi:ferredoxin